MDGFYWVIEGTLAGCPRPGGPGSRRPGDEPATEATPLLHEHLSWLRRQRVGALLSLTETPLAEEALARHTFELLHLPMADLSAPSPAQFEEALSFIDRQHAFGRAVAVHCKMGQGRTGTVLAAYLIRGGLSPDRAIEKLRRLCPGAVGSPVQEQALAAFARRRDWIV